MLIYLTHFMLILSFTKLLVLSVSAVLGLKQSPPPWKAPLHVLPAARGPAHKGLPAPQNPQYDAVMRSRFQNHTT